MSPDETDQRPRVTGLAVLRDGNFWPYFVGNLLSNCGTWFQNLAQALLVWRLTGSTLLVGTVNFAQFVGTFALAPWAGAAADRFDRRRLLLTTQLLAIAVTTVLALVAAADAATAPVVIGLALVLGVTTAFSAPAMLALVPLLVPEHELAGAVALNSVTFNLARAVGPVLGAAVIAAFGIPVAFACNAVSYLALVAALLVVHPRPQAPAPKQRPRLRESVALVLADRRLTRLFLAVAALSITADVVSTLGPAFASEIFGRPDTVTGLLVGTFGAGAVLAAFVIGNHRDVDRRIAVLLAVLGAGTIAFGLAPDLLFALPALAVAGFGFLGANATATTAIQLGVDDAQRGRVAALWSIAFLGVRPFASLADGALAAAFGLRAAAVLMAVPALAAAAMFTRVVRRSGALPRPNGA